MEGNTKEDFLKDAVLSGLVGVTLMKKMGVSLLHPWTHLQLTHPIFSTTDSGLSHVQAWAEENKNRRRYVTKFLIVIATPPPYWWLCPQAQPMGHIRASTLK